MADTNGFAFFAVIPDSDVRRAVRDHLEWYKGSFISQDASTDTTLTFEAGDVAQGSVEDCFGEILGLIRDGVEEFRCPACKGDGTISGGPHSVHQYPCEACNGDGFYSLPVPDFAFSINDEPQDEYLGSIHLHVPGLPDFVGSCDGNGNVVFGIGEFWDLLDKATSLESLRADAANLSGRNHLEHLRAAQANQPFVSSYGDGLPEVSIDGDVVGTETGGADR
jgi:hypothetical protein